MAEEAGFEPASPCGPAVFKTAAFSRSATPPAGRSYRGGPPASTPPSRGDARSATRTTPARPSSPAVAGAASAGGAHQEGGAAAGQDGRGGLQLAAEEDH